MTVLKKIKTLMIGSSLGQIISFITMPIITHCYSPDEIGTATVIISYIAIITSFASLGYGNAIFVSNLSNIRLELSNVAFLIGIVVSMLFAFPFFYFYLSLELHVSIISSLLVITSTLSIIILNFHTVNGDIKRIRDYNIINSSFLNPIKIIMSFNPTSLSILFGQLIRDLFIFLRFRKEVSNISNLKCEKHKYKETVKKAGDFPLYNLPNVAVNAFGALLPILSIGYIYDVSSVAMFEVANKYTSMLAILVASSISSVYISEFMKNIKNENDNLQQNMVRFLIYVIPCGVLSSVFILVLVPEIIERFMPRAWNEAIIIVYTYIYYVPFLIAGTIYGRVFTIISRQGYSLFWNILKVLSIIMLSYYAKAEGVGFLNYVKLLVFTQIFLELVRVILVYFLLAPRFIKYEK
ncbi:lipopolysaccharide biosynthesis protein [Vibrio sp. MA64]|uniref:lipopolysaccharide biosynthesis protein n=1 Tax=Vibrio sp. MA64 TaxID=2896365 RepID=UPI001E458B04|nr:hypothetical protein [Vibrio sp. MA64]MCC9651540.1 hypothetical protein [Vibrio sp. MA64]